MTRLFSIILLAFISTIGANAKNNATTDSVNSVIADCAIDSRSFLLQATHMSYAGRDYQVLPATNYISVSGDNVIIQVSPQGAPEIPGTLTQSGTITRWKEKTRKNGDREIDFKIKSLSRVINVNILIYKGSNEGVAMVDGPSKIYLTGTIGKFIKGKVVEGFVRP